MTVILPSVDETFTLYVRRYELLSLPIFKCVICQCIILYYVGYFSHNEISVGHTDSDQYTAHKCILAL